MKMHPSITADLVCEAVERRNMSLDDPGFCTACGWEHDGCDPDMRKGTCNKCGAKAVCGAVELMFHLVA
jgi:hypothetical protein